MPPARTVRPLALPAALTLLLACAGEPVFLPAPIEDDDPYSALAAAVRAYNQGVEGASIEAVGDAIDSLRSSGELDPRVRAELDRVEAEVAGNPGYIDPRRVGWLVALGNLDARDTFYVLYGWLHDWEIERERDFVADLELAAGLSGYRLVVDEATAPEEWYAYMARRDAAGLLWRSEGWVSHHPELPDDVVVARVWSTTFEGEEKARIFATDWANVVPEGLVSTTIASCGTAGPFLDDEMNALEDLGDPQKLTVRTFHTELHGRNVFLRTYAGLLATSGYHFSALDNTGLARLPDRADLAPERAAGAFERLVTEIADDPWDSHAVLAVLSATPEKWIPMLIDALEAGHPVLPTLEALSLFVTGTRQSLATAEEWRDWWLVEGEIHVDLPAEVDLWLALAADFTRATGYYKGEPTKGAAFTSYCHESWFRRVYTELGPWRRSEGGTLVRSAPTTDRFGRKISNAELVIGYDRETGIVSHNLDEVIGAMTAEEIAQICSSGA